MAEIIRLRAHHLLCLHGFRGLGYSEEFAANMARIHKLVMAGQGISVKLVIDADDICSACPKLDAPDSGCSSRASAKDVKVLSLLDIAPETVTDASDALQRTRELMTPETFRSLCKGCGWYSLGYCAEGLFGGSRTE